MSGSPNPYAKVSAAYVNELAHARSRALEWWDVLHERERRLTGASDAAEQSIRQRWPMGPASHPYVIAVFRKYFLLIEDLNAAMVEKWEAERPGDPLDDELWRAADDAESPLKLPRTILFERLSNVDPVLGGFMQSLVFIPIGSDQAGRVL